MTYPVLVLGGYGNFGGKISAALAKDSTINVMVAGRSKQKANQFAAKLGRTHGVDVMGVELDIFQDNLAAAIASTGAKLVIHSCGPFQGQGYEVAEACIASGINYIDLADGRQFVKQFKTLDNNAKENHVLAITGASSVPGLSSAVVNEYISEFESLTELEYGISPGNQADRGEATVHSILSYTGRPFTRWQNKAWQTVYGWQEIHRHPFPAPMGKRWLANCDIPDLELFQDYYPELKNIKFYAGLELGFLHVGLWLLSGIVRMRMIDNLARYSKIMTQMSTWVQSWGSDIGGMYIRLSGIDSNKQSKTIQWDLVAEQGHGPEIPTLPAIILAKKLASGALAKKGAMACVGLFSLAEFTQELEAWDIWQTTHISE